MRLRLDEEQVKSGKIKTSCKLRMLLRPTCVVLALAILLISASVSAATRPRGVGVRLEYERGPSARQCPDAKALRGEVAAELGSDPFTEAGPWRLHAAILRRKNGAFVATAELFDSSGELFSDMGEMVDPNCRTLVLKFLALWASVVLTDPPPPLPAALPSAAPPLPEVAAAPPPPGAADAPPAAFRLRLGAGTGIEIGVGPTPTPLFALSVGLQTTQTPIVSMALEVRSDLPLTGTGYDGARVHAHVLSGSVLTCFHFLDKGLLFGCVMYSAGALLGEDRRSAASAAGVYSAAGGRMGVAIPFASHRFAFNLAGDVLATLHPLRLRLDKQPVWQTGTAAGAFQVGVSAFF